MRTRLYPAVLVLGGLLAVSCTGDQKPTEPSFQTCDPEKGSCGGGGGGGTVSDPNPAAPGIWLGYNTGPSRCYSATGAGINDADLDRFDDWCEQLIMNAFRPLLRFSPYDCNIGMEPRYSVKYFPQQQRARVGYWLSYYKDCGNQGAPCTIGGAWSANVCYGHQGDTEFIIIDLSFDAVAQHWRVEKTFLSAHFAEEPQFFGTVPGDYSTFSTYVGLEYPAKQRGYFRVWVAHGKHGNYKTQSACNSGAIMSADDCTRHLAQLVEQRATPFNNRNVGSPAGHLEDCTRATGVEAPFRTRTECYWSTQRSTGWWDPAPSAVTEANSATGYAVRVLPVVFETFLLPREPS
jgi:hypothetical protein